MITMSAKAVLFLMLWFSDFGSLLAGVCNAACDPLPCIISFDVNSLLKGL